MLCEQKFHHIIIFSVNKQSEYLRSEKKSQEYPNHIFRLSSFQGDSGGPFVCNEGGKYVLRGAVSWGHSQCRTDHFTVFARVSSFIGWINNKMAGK